MAFDPYTPAMHAALEAKKHEVYAALGRYKYWKSGREKNIVRAFIDAALIYIIFFFFVIVSPWNNGIRFVKTTTIQIKTI